MVGVVGCAPTRHYWQQILSLSRLLNYDIPPYKWFRSYFTVINGFLNLAVLLRHAQAIVVSLRLNSERMTFGSAIRTTSFYRLWGR